MSCPICSQPIDLAYRPFCSKRCANVDLGRWMNGSYALPDTSEEEDDRPVSSPISDTGEPH